MSGRRIATVHESFDSRDDIDAVSERSADGGSSGGGAGLNDQPLRSQLLGLCLCAFYASFVISGLTLLGLSAWLLGIRLWTCPVFAAYYAPLWIFLASGILLLVSGMLGLLYICCMQQYQQQQQPEHQQHQALLQQVATVLLVLLVLSLCGLFGALVLSAKYGNDAQARDTAQEVQSLFVQAKLDYMDSLNRGAAASYSSMSATPASVLQCWESLQSAFGCCGAESYADWYSYRNGTRYYDSPRPAPSTSVGETVSPSDSLTSASSPGESTTVSETTSAASSSTTSGSSSGGGDGSTVAELILIAPNSCTCSDSGGPHSNSSAGHGSTACVPVSGLSLNGKSSASPYRVHGQGCIGPVKFAVRQHMAVMTSSCSVVAILVLAHFLFACLLPRLSQRPDSRCIYAVDTGPHPTAYIAQTNKRYDVTAFAAGPTGASRIGRSGDRAEAF